MRSQRSMQRCDLLRVGIEQLEARQLLSTSVSPAVVIPGLFGGERPPVIADIDGNLTPDIITFGGRSVAFQRNNGDRTFTGSTRLNFTGNIAELTQGDFNGDGRADLAVSTVSPDKRRLVRVLLGDAQEGFRRAGLLVGGGGGQARGWNDLVAMDTDGDGRDELVRAYEDRTNHRLHIVRYQLEDRDLVYAGTYVDTGTTGGLIVQRSIADTDGDGRADLVVVQRNNVRPTLTLLFGGSWSRQQGDAPVTPEVSVQRPTWDLGYQTLNFGDADGDGDADIVVSSQYTTYSATDRTFRLVINRGARNPLAFDEAVTFGSLRADHGGSMQVTGAFIIDHDRDGDVELVAHTLEVYSPASRAVSAVYIAWVLELPTSQDEATDDPGLPLLSMFDFPTWTDLDADGAMDLVGVGGQALSTVYSYSRAGDRIEVQWNTPENKAPVIDYAFSRFTSQHADARRLLHISLHDADFARGQQVLVESFADLNGNAQIDAGDLLLYSDLSRDRERQFEIDIIQPWADPDARLLIRATDDDATMAVYPLDIQTPQLALSIYDYPPFGGGTAGYVGVSIYAPGVEIDRVEFWYDRNRNNMLDEGDISLPTDVDGTDGWALRIPTNQPWARQPIRIFARVTDELGRVSPVATTQYANPNPIVRKVEVRNAAGLRVSNIRVGQTVEVRAIGVSDPDERLVGSYSLGRLFLDVDQDGVISAPDIRLEHPTPRNSSRTVWSRTFVVTEAWRQAAVNGRLQFLATARDSTGFGPLQLPSVQVGIRR